MQDPRKRFEDALTAALTPWSVTLGAGARALLYRHYDAMVAANRTVNLTRITDPAEAAAKHYADALALWHWLSRQGSGPAEILDVGTGAGFPAVPLAVAMPDILVTAIDATRKKVEFLAGVVRRLALTNVRAIHARAETWRPDHQYDLVTMRAVAKLGICVKRAAQHVAPGGSLLIYKTAKITAEERQEGRREADRAGLTTEAPWRYELRTNTETLERRLEIFHHDHTRG